MAFQVDLLAAGYPELPDVVRGLSLDVEPGEIVSILGPNGAGKSTTLRATFGIIRRSGGSVTVDGREIPAGDPIKSIDAGVGYVPEGRRLFAAMTVEENLLLGLFRRRRERDLDRRVETMYELFPVLRARRRQLAGSLSGGEGQMLAIGRALVSGPRYLLLDEPSIGLAPRIVDNLIDVFKRLASGGTGVLLVEQNATLGLKSASRVLTMRAGQIQSRFSATDERAMSYIESAYFGPR